MSTHASLAEANMSPPSLAMLPVPLHAKEKEPGCSCLMHDMQVGVHDVCQCFLGSDSSWLPLITVL